jgi:hypothetical protein
MSTLQEYWDACLIMAWRNFENYQQAKAKFHSITGLYPEQVDPPLLRLPVFYPYTCGVRHMIFSFLPKINTWLLEHEKDKDINLLKNLKGSKYTCQERSQDQRDRASERYATRKNQLRVNFETMSYNKRNRKTDWDVVK